MVHSNKKNKEERTIYVQSAFSVQKGHIKNTVAPKGHKDPRFYFECWFSCVCRLLKNTLEKKP